MIEDRRLGLGVSISRSLGPTHECEAREVLVTAPMRREKGREGREMWVEKL